MNVVTNAPEGEQHTVYRIVELYRGKVKTLFHGIQGCREITPGHWHMADKKMVKDGTSKTKYLSGFNVLKNRKECEEYLSRFTAPRDLKVVECLAVGLRPKEHSPSPVFLADWLKVLADPRK